MDQLREFASMLVVASVACCAIKMLLPESALEPVLKVVLSAFFLLCLILPLRGFAPAAPSGAALEESAAPRREKLAETYGEQLAKAVEENLSRVIGARLEKMGAPGTKLRINVNTGEGQRIDISGVEVFLDAGHAAMAQEIEDYIAGELELPCEIRAEELDDGS